MTITKVNVVGDSTVAGTIFSANQWAGGLGCWTELFAQRLANVLGFGPYLSPGLRSVALGIGPFPTDWTFSGSWTTVTSADAFDRLEFGYGKYGSGATLIATWPKPSRSPAIVGFDYWWVDIKNGATNGGNASYSLDGGSTWTTLTETLHNDNLLNKCYIPSAINSNGFKVRMADASGTAVLGMPAGITPYYVDPRTVTTGVILNSIAINGQQLHNFVQSTSGDRMAVFGSVRPGSGSPISSDPTLTLMLHVNDIQFADASQWDTDLRTFYTKASTFGPVIFIKPWAIETTDYDATQQTLYAAQTSTTAASVGALVLDMNALWTGLGFSGVTAQGVTAGFLGDLLHPSQKGALEISNRVYWFVRGNIFPSYGKTPSNLVAGAKADTSAYTGKAAAVAYSSGAPIGVVLQ